MNPSTASGRLVKDTLWRLICELGYDNCHQCKLPMTRETFTIEHKEPWLDSENPIELFFNQSNISFSHLKCNISVARKTWKSNLSEVERDSISNKKYYQSIPVEKRRAIRRRKYLQYGK